MAKEKNGNNLEQLYLSISPDAVEVMAQWSQFSGLEPSQITEILFKIEHSEGSQQMLNLLDYMHRTPDAELVNKVIQYHRNDLLDKLLGYQKATPPDFKEHFGTYFKQALTYDNMDAVKIMARHYQGSKVSFSSAIGKSIALGKVEYLKPFINRGMLKARLLALDIEYYKLVLPDRQMLTQDWLIDFLKPAVDDSETPFLYNLFHSEVS